MERAEYSAGSIAIRGSSAIHRVLSFLGAVLLGIGPAARRDKEAENWWDSDYDEEASSTPMVLGEQAELFDESGQVTFQAAPELELPAKPEVAVQAEAQPGRTMVTVQPHARQAARVVATRRVAPVVKAVATTKVIQARGDVARHLLMSQSISSGKEHARRFSVPRRALLPRFQLFEGAAGVVEDERGNMKLPWRSMRKQRGRVWFVS